MKRDMQVRSVMHLDEEFLEDLRQAARETLDEMRRWSK